MSDTAQNYLMSFGTGGLNVPESAAIARARLAGAAWEEVTAPAFADQLFLARKAGTAKRLAREATHRIRMLDDAELALLADGTRAEQAALLWVAACRTYRFIREWAEQVLAEQAAGLRRDIGYADFDRFLAETSDHAPELASLTVSTRAKLRAVLFRFMREAELLGADGRLTLALPPVRVSNLLTAARSGELRLFPGVVPADA